MGTGILAFLAIAAVVVATPGPDTALTIRNTLMGGRRAGVLTAMGIVAGLAVWTAAAAIGLAALLVASQPVFLAIRVAGGAYLVYLGLVALRSAARPKPDLAPAMGASGVGDGTLVPAIAFRQGLLCNLGNPKIAIFFTSLLPQFVPAGSATLLSFLALGAIFAAMGFGWLCGFALLVDRAGDVFRRGRVRRAMDAITGTVLVVFGARLATEPL